MACIFAIDGGNECWEDIVIIVWGYLQAGEGYEFQCIMYNFYKSSLWNIRKILMVQ